MDKQKPSPLLCPSERAKQRTRLEREDWHKTIQLDLFSL